jgi:hypothetical protein
VEKSFGVCPVVFGGSPFSGERLPSSGTKRSKIDYRSMLLQTLPKFKVRSYGINTTQYNICQKTYQYEQQQQQQQQQTPSKGSQPPSFCLTESTTKFEKKSSTKENNDNNCSNLLGSKSLVSLQDFGKHSSRGGAITSTLNKTRQKLRDRLASRKNNDNNNNNIAAVASSSLLVGTRSNNNNNSNAVVASSSLLASRSVSNNNNNSNAVVASSSLLASRSFSNNNNNVAAAAVASGSVKNNTIPPGVSIFRSGEGRHLPLFITSKPPSGDSPLHVIAALATSHSNDDGITADSLLRSDKKISVGEIPDNGKKFVIPYWKTDKQGNTLNEVYLIPQKWNIDQDVIIGGLEFTVIAGCVMTYVDGNVLPLSIIPSRKRQAIRDKYKKGLTVSIMESGEQKILATIPHTQIAGAVLGVRNCSAKAGNTIEDYVYSYTEEIDGEMVTSTRTTDVKITKYDGHTDGEMAKVTKLGVKVLHRPHLVIPESAIPSRCNMVKKCQKASAKYVSTLFVDLVIVCCLISQWSLIHYTVF